MVLSVDFHGEAVRVWHATATGARAVHDTEFTPTLYVHGPPERTLATLRGHVRDLPDVAATAIESHRPGFRHDIAPMLRVDVTDIEAVTPVARQLRSWETPGEHRLFDVDFSPEFRYCLETETEPTPSVDRPLRTCRLTATDSALAADRLSELTIDDTTVTGETAVLDTVAERLATADPDVLIVSHAAMIPELLALADSHDRSDFHLGRATGCRQRAGRSTYTSYGRVGHSPARYSVPGRVLINAQHSFLWSKTNLAGCRYLAARSGKPLQELAWASIGNVLTAIQIRAAHDRDVRVPWNSWRHERFKSMQTLHEADRGGVTLEPAVGVHENVYEVDFASLYPAIMRTQNISPETVRCDCHDTADVPELGYSICETRGYLPDVLGPLIDDRQRMKRALATASESDRRETLRGKIDAIKWILVSCFGYQGFSNAKFGRIEAHEAINAFAREILLTAKHRLEAAGWRVVHGIVDSLWVTPADPDPDPLTTVCQAVTDATDVLLEREAHYNWVAFVPQRHRETGALTKYFGAVADNGNGESAADYRYRGIECRQRSSCPYVARAQRQLVETFDTHRTAAAVCDRLSGYLTDLQRGDVDATDLAITHRISQPLEAYDGRTRTVAALERAAAADIDLHPGESVTYVVVNDETESRERVRLTFEVTADTRYDTSFYRTRLLRATESILSPLGWRRAEIRQAVDGRDANLLAYSDG